MTGFGVAEAADAAAQHRARLAGAAGGHPGFGAVGGRGRERLAELGAVVVAVSTAAGGVHDPDGLDVAAAVPVCAPSR